MINEIIKMQSNCKSFVKVAKKENLLKLTKSELTLVYNVTFVAYHQ